MAPHQAGAIHPGCNRSQQSLVSSPQHGCLDLTHLQILPGRERGIPSSSDFLPTVVLGQTTGVVSRSEEPRVVPSTNLRLHSHPKNQRSLRQTALCLPRTTWLWNYLTTPTSIRSGLSRRHQQILWERHFHHGLHLRRIHWPRHAIAPHIRHRNRLITSRTHSIFVGCLRDHLRNHIYVFHLQISMSDHGRTRVMWSDKDEDYGRVALL